MLGKLADRVRSLGGHAGAGETDASRQPPSSPPLLAGTWTGVAPADALSLMVRVAARVDPIRVICMQHDVVAVRSRSLDCVADGLLIEFDVADRDGAPAGCGAFVYRPGLVDPLDGQSARLHRLADEGALLLDTAERALEYCQLFAASVQGGDGCFFPYPPDLPLHVQEHHPCAAASLETARQPFSVCENGESWDVDMTVAYSAALFRAQFRIGRSGMIEMIDDRILCGIAPVRSEGWADGLRSGVAVEASDSIDHCPACPFGEKHARGDNGHAGN